MATRDKPLIVQLQTLLGVVLLAMTLHVTCAPYKLPDMNALESVSLVVTSVSIYLCFYILQPLDVVSKAASQALSIILVAINALTVLYFLLQLIRELRRFMQRKLDRDRSGRVGSVPCHAMHTACIHHAVVLGQC